MKKITKLFLLAVVACSMLLMTSCVGFNLSSTSDRGQTAVSLSQNNYHVVKRVSGEVSCHKLFGIIGGLSQEYLKNSAISKMYENANLTGSQTIVDIHVVKSKSLHLITVDESMIATGTVIEFDGPNTMNVKVEK